MTNMKELEESLGINKEEMVASNGNPITQSLFLETGYSPLAQYTLKDRDYEYKGKVYPSIKRLYLEEEDIAEFEFASKYLLGWSHWVRITENADLRPHVDSWRQELNMKMRSRAAKQIMQQAKKGSFQASKWMMDKGWEERKAGRPSRAEAEARAKEQEAIDKIFQEDYKRLKVV